VGIRGNKDADIAAKAGLDVPITNIRFPVSDWLTGVNQLCVKEWQQLWNQCTANKLYSVQLVVGRSVSSSLGLAHWGCLVGRCASLCLQAAHGGRAAGGSG